MPEKRARRHIEQRLDLGGEELARVLTTDPASVREGVSTGATRRESVR